MRLKIKWIGAFEYEFVTADNCCRRGLNRRKKVNRAATLKGHLQCSLLILLSTIPYIFLPITERPSFGKTMAVFVLGIVMVTLNRGFRFERGVVS
ncbi:hypothetical protein BKA69DRAFT_937047 [Paraphysoderma sedebokerense]|nr:hypothetical protein BKA69DRAFT_937047 [Paraphysoderma sedebokerense]